MWFKVDDGWPVHPKTRLAGKDGRALWMAAGASCAALQTDGRVPGHMVADWAYLAGVTAKKAAALLVAAGLWHDADTIHECGRCLAASGPLDEGDFYYHDWLEYQPTKDETLLPTERIRWRRKKALHRNRELCEAITSRDRNQCRYCGVRVNWKDKVGRTGGTYDHVDPDGDNSLSNVVVCCRSCNTAKADRTPDEAGMVLLDPPDDLAGTKSGPSPDLVGVGSSRARGDGPSPGQVRAKSETVLNGHGSSTNGSHQ